MSEYNPESEHPNQQETETQSPTFKLKIVSQYVRDLSLETPQPAYTLSKEYMQNPHLKIDFNIGLKSIEKDTFEVILKVNAQSTDKESEITFYLISLSYVGIFSLNDRSIPNIRVMIEGAHILFPFVRAILITLSLEAGFPPLMISPIDFADLYRRRIKDTPNQQVSLSKKPKKPPSSKKINGGNTS